MIRLIVHRAVRCLSNAIGISLEAGIWMNAAAASFAVRDFQGASMRSLVHGDDTESRSLFWLVRRVTSKRRTVGFFLL